MLYALSKWVKNRVSGWVYFYSIFGHERCEFKITLMLGKVNNGKKTKKRNP
jgi:hypothetical protein